MNPKHRWLIIALAVAGVFSIYIWNVLPASWFVSSGDPDELGAAIGLAMVFIWSLGALIVVVLAAIYWRSTFWVLAAFFPGWPVSCALLLLLRTPRLLEGDIDQAYRKRIFELKDLRKREKLIAYVIGTAMSAGGSAMLVYASAGWFRIVAWILAIGYFLGCMYLWVRLDRIRAESMGHYLRAARDVEMRTRAAFALASEPPEIIGLAEEALKQAMDDPDEDPAVKQWVERAVSRGQLSAGQA